MRRSRWCDRDRVRPDRRTHLRCDQSTAVTSVGTNLTTVFNAISSKARERLIGDLVATTSTDREPPSGGSRFRRARSRRRKAACVDASRRKPDRLGRALRPHGSAHRRRSERCGDLPHPEPLRRGHRTRLLPLCPGPARPPSDVGVVQSWCGSKYHDLMRNENVLAAIAGVLVLITIFMFAQALVLHDPMAERLRSHKAPRHLACRDAVGRRHRQPPHRSHQQAEAVPRQAQAPARRGSAQDERAAVASGLALARRLVVYVGLRLAML
jgi:hypothetical protein